MPTKSELYELGKTLPETSHFEEVTTLGHRNKFDKLFVSVFLFPGLSKARLQALIKKLLYPTFCLKLPAVWQTIEETASDLVQVSVYFYIFTIYNTIFFWVPFDKEKFTNIL